MVVQVDSMSMDLDRSRSWTRQTPPYQVRVRGCGLGGEQVYETHADDGPAESQPDVPETGHGVDQVSPHCAARHESTAAIIA